MRAFRNAALVLVFALCAASGAVAQTCIGPVEGVPGQANQPPHWFDDLAEPGVGVPQPAYNKFLDDPRWVRAGAISYNDGAGDVAFFRASHDATSVYLSWRIDSPPVSTAAQNVLYFGFVAPGGTVRIVRLQLPSTSPAGGTPTNPAGVPVAPTMSFMHRDAATGHGVADATPAWLAQTARAWSHRPLDTWAIQVRIPKSEVAITATEFKFWFQAYTGTLTLPVSRFTWPRGPQSAVTEGGFPADAIFPDPATPNAWDSFKTSTGPLDGVCASQGVSINYDSVGTTNSPSNRILFKAVPPAAAHPINKFFARPRNFSGVDIPQDKIRATFKIANWGSMPNWEDGVDINQLWAPITCGTDASPTETKCGSDVPNKAQINSGTTATTTNQIEFDWALTNAQLAPFASGAKRADNCLLVQLSSTMTPGLTFTASSVKKNMMFAQASTFTHEADVSIKGLGAVPGGRDVYIWVRTLNMPEKVAPGTEPARIPIRRNGCGDPPPPSRNDPRGPGLVAEEPETVAVTDAVRLAELAAAGQLCQRDLDAGMPTYRVQVYHDTGERVTLGGTSRPILRAQGSFGYRLAHDGPLTGWRHQLAAEGFTLEELAPNFYRIAKVPTDGVVKVKTTISAQGAAPGFRIFADLGFNMPHGAFSSSGINGRVSFNAGIEGFVTPDVSLEGIVGYHAFDGGANPDPNVWQFSGNAKWYFGPGPARGFVNAGAGAYRINPAGTTKAGTNVGGGFTYDVTSRWALETVYNLHVVYTTGDATKFSTIQAGVRIRVP